MTGHIGRERGGSHWTRSANFPQKILTLKNQDFIGTLWKLFVSQKLGSCTLEYRINIGLRVLILRFFPKATGLFHTLRLLIFLNLLTDYVFSWIDKVNSILVTHFTSVNFQKNPMAMFIWDLRLLISKKFPMAMLFWDLRLFSTLEYEQIVKCDLKKRFTPTVHYIQQQSAKNIFVRECNLFVRISKNGRCSAICIVWTTTYNHHNQFCCPSKFFAKVFGWTTIHFNFIHLYYTNCCWENQPWNFF